MTRIITALLLSIALLIPTSLKAASEWTSVAATMGKSIVFLTGPKGGCTAWVINEARDLVLTAAHCDQQRNGDSAMLVNSIPAILVAKDSKKDLMVLYVPGIDKPALHLAKYNPVIGDEIASYGYGLGLERPIFRITHVSDNQLYIPFEGIGGPFILTDTNFIGGQSGCPVVNLAAEVVMIVQMSANAGFGLGVGSETIKDKMGRYFEVVK